MTQRMGLPVATSACGHNDCRERPSQPRRSRLRQDGHNDDRLSLRSKLLKYGIMGKRPPSEPGQGALRAALVFGVVAATIEMAIILALLYC